MEHGDNHEGPVSTTRGFFRQSLKKENVVGLRPSCSVLKILAKFIQNKEEARMPLAPGFGDALLYHPQNVVGSWPIATTTPLNAERTEYRHAERLVISCRHCRQEGDPANKMAELSWKLALRAPRNSGQHQSEISLSRSVVAGDAPGSLCGVRPKPCRDPLKRLLGQRSEQVSERGTRILNVALKMNRPHEPRMNSEQCGNLHVRRSAELRLIR
jgi:hypothetical protein